MTLDKTSLEEEKKRIADFFREFIVFFAGLFFTCVVGIIELLPELEKINGVFSGLAFSLLYFGLLLGVNYSVYKFFQFYEYNKNLVKKHGRGFSSHDIDYLARIFKNSKNLQWLILVLTTFVFVLLYLVKLGIIM